jgi:nitronate monooxygenase
MVTREAPIHDRVKQAMVDATELDTALLYRSLRNTARVFKNAVAEQVLEIESREGPTDFDDIAPLVKGTRGRELFESGNLHHGIWSAGMVIGLIDDIPTCEELIARIVAEAEQIISQRLTGLLR